MMDTAEQAYRAVREAARVNEDVLGFVLTGSRGKDARFVHAGSDYDFALFVRDDVLEKYQQQYGDLPAGARIYIFTLDSFRETLAWRGMQHWQRYTWARLAVEFDRSGGAVHHLLDQAAHVPEAIYVAHIRQSLRWYFSQVYHSLKNYRRGDMIGYRLEAVESIRPFLEALFCLHGRRIIPYYKYLRWEMELEPLDRLPLASNELLTDLRRILADGDYQTQQILMWAAKEAFSPAGFGELFTWYNVNYVLQFPEKVDPAEYKRPWQA